MRWCDIRQLTAPEREMSARREKENAKRRAAAYRPEARRRWRKRYRTDPEFRERIKRQRRESYARHRDEINERARLHRIEHHEEVLLKEKVRQLKRLREEKSCGSAT